MSVRDPAALLARLIALDTRNPGGDERACAHVLADLLALDGPDELRLVEVPRGGGSRETGAYVYARFGPGRPRLLVNAHLDTVPVDAGWEADPLVARRAGDRVVGLGAADTKGAIAAAVTALADARPDGVALLFSGDEERDGTCVRAFLASPAAAQLERAVVCEPTGCRVGTRHRGILALTARVTGVGGHSSRADSLPAPVAELANLAVALQGWGAFRRDRGPPGFPGQCLNLARLVGGVGFSVVPREAALSFSVRPPPGTSVAAVRAELEALGRRVVPGVELGVEVENPSFATRAPAAFAAFLGEPAMAAAIDLPFWTEAATFAEAGIDAVVYGPGDIAQAHAVDEWVALADLERARAVFAELYRTV